MDYHGEKKETFNIKLEENCFFFLFYSTHHHRHAVAVGTSNTFPICVGVHQG